MLLLGAFYVCHHERFGAPSQQRCHCRGVLRPIVTVEPDTLINGPTGVVILTESGKAHRGALNRIIIYHERRPNGQSVENTLLGKAHREGPEPNHYA